MLTPHEKRNEDTCDDTITCVTERISSLHKTQNVDLIANEHIFLPLDITSPGFIILMIINKNSQQRNVTNMLRGLSIILA
jgi:hypothetical protein